MTKYRQRKPLTSRLACFWYFYAGDKLSQLLRLPLERAILGGL